MEPYYIPSGIAALIFIYIAYIYNRLITLRNQADTAYANIDTLLQKRFDLIPNLISTVKGYMQHERELLETVTRTRTDWLNASTVQQNAGADETSARALKSLFAVAENYPELKANQNFLMLQEELTGIENKIAYSRQRFNRTIMVLNTKIQKFPSNLIASIFGFRVRDFFTVESEQVRQVPGLDFGGENS